MFEPDDPELSYGWYRWYEKHGKNCGFQDAYGNPVELTTVESLGPATSFEDELIFEMDFLELLKKLPELARLAIEKRLKGIPLNPAEQKALERSKDRVRKWLETRSRL